MPQLNDKQIERLSEALSNLSVGVLVSIFLPAVSGNMVHLNVILVAAIVAFAFLITSLAILKNE